MENTTRKEILKVCMSKGFLLDSEMLEVFGELDIGSALEVAEGLKNLGIEERVITKKVFTQNFEKIKNVLETNSRDFPSKFILDLLVKEPKLLKFAPRLLLKAKAKKGSDSA